MVGGEERKIMMTLCNFRNNLSTKALYDLLSCKNKLELVRLPHHIPLCDHLVPLHPPGDPALDPASHLLGGHKNTIIKPKIMLKRCIFTNFNLLEGQFNFFVIQSLSVQLFSIFPDRLLSFYQLPCYECFLCQ